MISFVSSFPVKAATNILSGFIAGSLSNSFRNFNGSDFEQLYAFINSTDYMGTYNNLVQYALTPIDFSLATLLAFCAVVYGTYMYTMVNNCKAPTQRYVVQGDVMEHKLSTNDSDNQIIGDSAALPISTMNDQSQITADTLAMTIVPKHFTSKYDSLYGTPMFVKQIPITPAISSGTIVNSVSWSDIRANANVARLFRDYRYASFDIKLTVNITGNIMSTGTFLGATRIADPVIPQSYAASNLPDRKSVV